MSASSNDKSCEPSLSSSSFFFLCFLCLCFLCFFCSGNSFVSEIHQLHSFFNLIMITVINLAFNNTLSNKNMSSKENELQMMDQRSHSLLAYCWAQSQHLFGRNKECHKNPAWIFTYLYLHIIYHMPSTWSSQSKHKIKKKYKFPNTLQRNAQIPVNKTHMNYPNAII